MKKEIATKDNNTHLTLQKPKGFENPIETEDLATPFAKLLHPLSPEVLKEGMKAGTIINSLTKEQLSENFIPIFWFKNYMKFNAKDKKSPSYDPNYPLGSLIWKTDDPNDPRVEETKFKNGEKPSAMAVINFFSWFENQPMPIVISFAKSSYKTGKQLLSMTKFSNGNMFSRKYKLFSLSEENDIASFFVYKIALVGKATPEEESLCEELWKEYSKKQIETEEIEPE